MNLTQFLQIAKRTFIVTSKFYFSIFAVMVPFILIVDWPEDKDFSFPLLTQIFVSMLQHPLFYVWFSFLYVFLLLFYIFNKSDNAV